MSTETPPPGPEASESPRKPMDPRVRGILLATVAVLLLVAVAFGGNLRTKQTRVAELERSVDALSEAVEPSVLTDLPQKLQRLVTDIAKAGEYDEISIADNSGKILASTNSARVGTTSEAMKVSTSSAKAQFKDGKIVIRRAIILAGDTRYGNLEIRVIE